MVRISLCGEDWKIKDFVGEDWVWRNAHKRKTQDVRWWKPARVPGCVTDDMLRCHAIPDPHFERNSLLIEWIPQRTWVYRKEFDLEKLPEVSRVNLCFEGVDYDALFYVNDVFLGEHHSMFTPVSFDITGLLREGEKNLLAVVVNKAPDGQPQVSKTGYVKTHKSRMTYWWDFCPRMIHLGIWDDVYLDVTGPVHLGQPDLETKLSRDYKTASVHVTVEAKESEMCGAADKEAADTAESRTGTAVQRMRYGPKTTVTARLSFQGRTVGEECAAPEGGRAVFSFPVEEPALWWPNGCGEQPLYELEVEAYAEGVVSDTRRVRFGIRELRFVENETPDKTARPYTVCVNGRKLYLKGYNWVPIDAMYGVRRPQKLERLLRLAAEAHVNCLRIWGGGLIEREEFYDLCDEKGILLWQEFIQSSSGIENEPSCDVAFLELMEREAKAVILRKKHHPALALWGGGNELSGPEDSMITMEEPVIGLLGAQVKKYDPSRYFLESSPTGRVFHNTLENIQKDPLGLHDVHGPWEHQGLKEQYTLYNAGTSLLSSEFGVEGMASLDVLLRHTDPARLWPPSRDNEVYFHRGSWWNNYPLVQACFGGKLGEIGQAVRASQFLQYEGLRYAVEANRRRALTCSGTFPWQFNEPFPNHTCTCSVDYYAAPKPAYYGVKQAYAENTVTARFAGQSLAGEPKLEAQIYWQSSSGMACGLVTARICDQKGRIVAERTFAGPDAAEPEKSVLLGTVFCRTEEICTPVCYLILSAKARGTAEEAASNRYLFTKTLLEELLRLEKTQIRCEVRKNTEGFSLTLQNTGAVVAAGVWMEDTQGLSQDGYLYFSQNYLHLLPGEKRCVYVKQEGGTDKILRVGGWNVETVRVALEEKPDG